MKRKRIVVVTQTGRRRWINMNDGRWAWIASRCWIRGMQGVWDGLSLLAGEKLAPEEQQPSAKVIRAVLEEMYLVL